jgi:TfoX/Sxy family transcriptional regulator of competence genes
VTRPTADPDDRARRAIFSDAFDRTLKGVAYDEELAERIRELVVGQPDLTESKMFGGLAFLVNGNMAIAASGQGGVLVRVDPAATDELVASSDATIAVMRGRPMDGWLRVAPDHLRTKRQLAKWVTRGTTYARSLPPKAARKRSQAPS